MLSSMLKRLVLLLFPSFFVIPSFSQVKTNPDEFIGFSIGRSKHGTGDIRGVAFNTIYSKKIPQKVFVDSVLWRDFT